MLDAYSESRRKRATWKVMFKMGECVESMLPRGVKGQRPYSCALVRQLQVQQKPSVMHYMPNSGPA